MAKTKCVRSYCDTVTSSNKCSACNSICMHCRTHYDLHDRCDLCDILMHNSDDYPQAAGVYGEQPLDGVNSCIDCEQQYVKVFGSFCRESLRGKRRMVRSFGKIHNARQALGRSEIAQSEYDQIEAGEMALLRYLHDKYLHNGGI